MEKPSNAYLSETARGAVRELYSGHNDAGLWSYASARKAAERLTGVGRALEEARLLFSRFGLRVLDGVGKGTLQVVDRIVKADSRQVGKFHSI